MISSAGTVGSRRPAPRQLVPRAAPGTKANGGTTTASSGVATVSSAKRPRELCEEELAHRALAVEKAAARHAVATQTTELVSLESNLLQFYYTHAICYNEDEPVPVDAQTGSARSGTASGMTAYYSDSEISRLRQALRERLNAYQREEADAAAALADFTAHVETEVVKGMLAKQQAAAAAAEARHQALLETLAGKQQQCEELRAAVERQKNACAEVQRKCADCAARRAVLEEKKRKQMDNVEATRLELEVARAATRDAQKELRRREAVVRDIQAEIDRRRSRLKQRKVLAN